MAQSFERWRHAAETLNELGWFLPAYIQGSAIFELVDALESAEAEERVSALADGVCALYAPRALAVMYLYRYRTWPFVREFESTILECILASSYGFLRVATTGLAPVVEGIARSIARDQGIEETNRSGPLVRDVLEELGRRAEQRGSESATAEIGLIIASYRRFFDERFWKGTAQRSKNETVGRHGLLHGVTLTEEYGTRYNFSRLISILDLFCCLIALTPPAGERLSVLAPNETEESRDLADYLGFAAAMRLAVEERTGLSRELKL